MNNRSDTQAASGTAQATGLAVQNSVNLAANLLVDIAGNNYGRITVRLLLITNIYNQGSAEARTGNATANGAPATTSLSGTGPETTEGVAPVMISASAASGGSSAGGNGGGGGGSATGNASAVSASGARSLSGTSNTVQTTTGSVNTVISNESASSATSGDGEGLGLRSQVVATSNQYVGISAPGAAIGRGAELHLGQRRRPWVLRDQHRRRHDPAHPHPRPCVRVP